MPPANSIDELLEHMVERNASDLHVTTGTPPVVRVRGEVERLDGYDPLTPEETQGLLYRILSSEQQKQLELKRQLDFSHSIPGLARFRVNVYFQRESLGAAFRLIPTELKTLEELGIPASLHQLAEKPRGLVLVTAQTGHLVFGTLHTQSAPSTIDRIIDVFPAEQQEQVRIQIASSLQGVVTQALLPTADGQGRVPALEILLPDDAVRNLIRQGKVEQIYSVMQTNTGRGMQTMEQSLAELIQRRVVDFELGLSRSSRPAQLIGLLERNGFPVDVPPDLGGSQHDDEALLATGLRVAGS